MAQPNPFSNIIKEIEVEGKKFKYFSLPDLKDKRIKNLPISIRVLLECAIRNTDNFAVFEKDVETILDWQNTAAKSLDIPFKPARVLLQDFTGVPAVVDLAAMRDAVKNLGGDAGKINPAVPVDLVIDHSVQVDVAGVPDAIEKNQAIEFERNRERFQFLKWGAQAFDGMRIVPPGNGIVHQVNLEFLARAVSEREGFVFPDSVVGTDSHTTMINGLGVVGWGVGGIEAEAVMMNQNIVLVIPPVVGYKLTGKAAEGVTGTDIVLTIVQNLRKKGVVGKFVEFYGPGVDELSLADRATIANMGPEYGATMGFFPVDDTTIDYLKQTGREDAQVKLVEKYLKTQGLYASPENTKDIVFSDELELDLSTVIPCVSGPKRPHDRIDLNDVKQDFAKCVAAPKGFKGFGISEDKVNATAEVEVNGEKFTLSHGSLILAAITSCTNTSNPYVMLAAGLVAKAAIEKGLKVPPYVKASLSPGSAAVSSYLEASGLQKYMDELGFGAVGYGCMTCIGNSGPINENIVKAGEEAGLLYAGVESGNRNFEGRVNPNVAACFLASPPLVVAFAIAGRINIDLTSEPLGTDKNGKPVFLKDVWPTNAVIKDTVAKSLAPEQFREAAEKLKEGTERWNSLEAPSGQLYKWDPESTYIHDPPFFKGMPAQPLASPPPIKGAYALLNVGDSITTDHISPAGAIAKACPAQRYLASLGVERKDFNSYGARRGNDQVMMRGTFANIRLVNKLASGPGPRTIHVPSNEEMDVFDAAERYKQEGKQLIVLAGAEYGSGSSRDYAAKGPYLLGVKAAIATSYERIHRSNLVGMGIIPLQFQEGESADALGLTGKETFDIDMTGELKPGMLINVAASSGVKFKAVLRFDTPVEIEYYRHGGILHYVIRKLAFE